MNYNITKILTEDQYNIEKLPPATKRPPQEEILKKKKAVVVNFTKMTNASKESSVDLFQGLASIIEEGKSSLKEIDLVCKSINVDLTKLRREIDDPKAKADINLARHMLVKLAVTKRAEMKKLHELKAKRMELEAKMEQSGYFRELESINRELKKKYGIDKLEKKADDVESEIAAAEGEMKTKLGNSLVEIEQQAKDILRNIRNILMEMYEIPEKLAEFSKLSVRAFNELTTISTSPSYYVMKQEGFDVILNSPELKQILEQYISVTEVSDKVRLVGASMEALGSYIMEAQNKAKELPLEVSKENITEGMFSGIINNSIDKIWNKIASFYKKIDKLLKDFSKKQQMEVEKINSNIQDINKKFVDGMAILNKIQSSIIDSKK